MKTATAPLTGEALLNKLSQLEHLSKEEKAEKCGYCNYQKNGTLRVNAIAFMNAILDAEGIDLDAASSGPGRGRAPDYKVTVQANGNVLIGPAYLRSLAEPGDEFEVRVGRKYIKLELKNSA